MADYVIRPLDATTWDAFAALAEKHNGVFGGCWCTWFHPPCAERGVSAEGNRAIKERLVREGKAHAALVFDGEVAVAWAEYGTQRSCRTSTTARSTTPPGTPRPTTGSPASSSTATTGAGASRQWRSVARST